MSENPSEDRYRIEFDTPFVGDDIYTRANAGEVFPQILSPLTWTLVGPSIERGFMRCMAGDFAAVSPIENGYLACGRMAGRLHLNLSVFRTVAERVPGSTAKDLDTQYFGDAVSSGLPAHPDERVPLRTTLRCTAAAVRTMASFARRVRKETKLAASATEQRRKFLAERRTATELLDAAQRETENYARLFGSHVTARALTSSAVSQAINALGRKGHSEHDAMSLISNIPDIESAKPSKDLQHIVASIEDNSLRLGLSEGMMWDELVSSSLPGAVVLHAQLSNFLELYEHRGVNEFDPSWPVWGTNPDSVLTLIRRIVASGVDDRPARKLEPVSGVSGLLVSNARRAIHRAENTKDNIIRISHNIRLYLDSAIAQLEDLLTPEQALACTYADLHSIAAGGEVDSKAIFRRLQEMEEVAEVEPAEWSVRKLSIVSLESAAKVDELVGLAGSNGVATGRVRTMRNVDDDFEDGEILVAASTDTAWTPLFLAAAAVVTDTGGPLSHATIVAREIGIPAVVNTKTAVRDLVDGDLVEVDGTTGRVRILQRVGE